MKSSLLLLSSAIVTLALLPQTGSKAIFTAHDKALKAAQSLSVTFTVQELPGAPSEYKLALGRPNLMRLETPTALVVTDGKTLWEYSKAENSYTESPVTPDAVNANLSGDATWAWSAFLVPEQFSKVKTADAGTKRMIKGKQVTDITIAFSDDRTGHLYFDQTLGFARGASIKSSKGELLILATDVKAAADAADPALFTFTAPAGAKKQEGPKPDEVTFATIHPILRNNCLPCHSAQTRRGNYEVASYAGVMKEVKAGDPAGSELFQYISGAKQPRMPMGRAPLSHGDIDLIRKWIAAGAKQ